MRRKSRNILAILLAASMMSSMCSIPAAGADFSSEEILATEDMQTEEPDQEVEESLESEDLESNPEEFLAEDPEVQPEEEPTDIEEEITSQTGEEQTPVNIGDGEEEDLFSAGDSEETSYNIWVGDIQVTDANKADVLGDLDGDARTVTFDATQKKLTLDNATITGELRLLESSDITLELKNQNKIVPYSDGRVMEDYILIRDTSTENSMKTCTITGGGSLSITDLEGVDFIESYQKLIIDGVKFNFTMAEDYDGYAVGIRSTKSVNIRNQSNITIKTNKSGGEAIADGLFVFHLCTAFCTVDHVTICAGNFLPVKSHPVFATSDYQFHYCNSRNCLILSITANTTGMLSLAGPAPSCFFHCFPGTEFMFF